LKSVIEANLTAVGFEKFLRSWKKQKSW